VWLAGGVELPRAPGTYAIVFQAPRPCRIAVGALGSVTLERGYWVYVGSALGAGGLRARVGRHLKGPGKPRWHVDYLHGQIGVVEVWLRLGRVRREHLWARALARQAAGWIPGFGCSDCRCPSHLFHFVRRPSATISNGEGLRAAAKKIVRLYCQMIPVSL